MKIQPDKILEFIHREVQHDFALKDLTPISGGSINSCYGLRGANEKYFLKINDATELENLKAESRGLNLLSGNKTLLVPEPIAVGRAGTLSVLVLPFLNLEPLTNLEVELLAQGLAEQHRQESTEFGLDYDNFIGSTVQQNRPEKDWPTFFRDHRLAPQIAMAASNGCRGSLRELANSLLSVIPEFFTGYCPARSLLHGDLWSGNVAGVGGRPAIFDPAVYFGDREADIAMTELFGGFPERFYAAYREAWPIDPGYEVRKHLYNLYHLFNHFNLFGDSYGSQAEQVSRRLLASVRG